MKGNRIGAKPRKGEPTAVLAEAEVAAKRSLRYVVNNALGGAYPIIRRLGEGGFGEVFLCRHPEWGIEVAVKAPRPGRLDEIGRAALEIEADAWIRLGLHPHCVYCYHLHPVDNVPLLVVEYVAGGTLRDHLKSVGSNVQAGIDLAIQLCHAMEHAHAHRFVHRDIKPENILLGNVVKLTDFGIANGGTAGYRAPEQVDALQTVDQRADLFAFGVCLFELFFGRRPYPAGAERERRAQPALLPGILNGRSLPVGLAELLTRLVSWDREVRPASAQAVRHELADIYSRAFWTRSRYEILPHVTLTAPGHSNRGVSHHFLGQIEAARAAFAEGLAADPLHPEAVFNHGLLAWRDAIITDDELVRRMAGVWDPSVAGRMLQLQALVHLERGAAEEAGRALDQLRQLAPDHDQLAGDAATIQKIEDLPTPEQLLIDRSDRGITAIAYLPQQQRALAADGDGKIILWDLKQGQQTGAFEGHCGPVTSIAVAEDRRAVSGGADGTVRCWDVAGRSCEHVLFEHSDWVSAVGVARDGTTAVSASWDGTLCVWDLGAGASLRRFGSGSAVFRALALSDDGRQVLSGDADGTVSLWDVATGFRRWCAAEHRGGVNALAFSPGEHNRAVSAGDDGRLILWDIGTGRLTGCLCGHQGRVHALAFVDDGRRVVSGGADRTVRYWDIASRRCLRTFSGHRSGVYGLAAIPAAAAVLSGGHDGELRWWRLPTSLISASLALARPEPLDALVTARGRAVALLREATHALETGRLADALHPLSKIAALPGQYGLPQVVELRHRLAPLCDRHRLLRSGARDMFEPHYERVSSLASSGDGRLTLCGGGHGWLVLWDIKRGAAVFESNLGSSIGAVALGAAGDIAAAACIDGTLHLLELPGGAIRHQFNLGRQALTSIMIDGDTSHVLVGSDNGTVRVLDVAKGPVRRFLGFAGIVTAVAFNTTGTLAVAGGADRTISVWDIASGRRLCHLAGHTSGIVAVVFSDNDRSVLSVAGDGSIRLWDIDTGRSRRSLLGSGSVRSAIFSSDGTLLMTGRSGGETWVQRVADGTVLRIFREGHEDVAAVALAGDASLAFSATGTRIRAWHLDWELVEKGANSPRR